MSAELPSNRLGGVIGTIGRGAPTAKSVSLSGETPMILASDCTTEALMKFPGTSQRGNSAM